MKSLDVCFKAFHSILEMENSEGEKKSKKQ